jgi:L-amino acid N-acyltransferase YncA
MAAGVAIRAAREEDFERVTAIYRRHVLEGTATFEIDPPGRNEMMRRWHDVVGRRLPWLVAEAGGEVVGYGYAGVYRLRVAYRYTVEDSIYLDPGWTGRRIGRALLAQLLVDCERVGCRQMVAVIGDSANAASVGVHRALGFRDVGVLRDVGFKFGRWLDTVFMQRALGGGGGTLPDLSAGILGERG